VARATKASFAVFDTKLGTCAIAWGPRGLRAVELPEPSPAHLRRKLKKRLGTVEEVEPPAPIRAVIGEVKRYLAGRGASFDAIEIDLDGVTPFTRRVYETLRQTRAGETVSYGELAARAGRPGAARAVGQAMAKNPLPLLVPCHRVLGHGGTPGGFSSWGGMVTKAELLEIEGVTLGAAAAPRSLRGTTTVPYDAVAALGHLRKADPQLGALIDRVGAFRLELQKPRKTFEALAESIVYQQLTGKAAATIWGRVKERLGGAVTAEAVAAASDATLRGAGLSGAKAAALRDLSARTLAGTVPPLPRLRRMDDEAIVEQLSEVRGIGRWTVEMLLIFGLGRPDVLPVDDYGVRKGFGRAFRTKELPKPREVAERGERWRPWRSVASWYLWRANDLPD
jgi:methylated-DNA-[protein]-cysteine S-methyltransferase